MVNALQCLVTKQTLKEAFTMSISTLSQFDRGAIYQLLVDGHSQNEIARRLNVSKSTISTELKRIQPYNPKLAQADAYAKRRHCGRNVVLTDDLKVIIKNHLKLTWSPEQIAHEFHLCTKSIYNWIYTGLIDFDLELLPDKSRRIKHKKENRGTFKIEETIESRPDKVNDRESFGHWEVDTVLSSRGQSKSCLATFVERQSRFIWAIKINDRSKSSMSYAFSIFMNTFERTVKSITVDHGKEFSGYQQLKADYDLSVYFCHPYSPWERGTNEYFNRKLRWFFPKKTNFEFIANDDVIEAIELINGRPLKILGWKTAIEAFREYYFKCSD